MDVKQAISERRAYRSFESVEITDELINKFAESAGLAPSCFNNQPWRFVFVYEPELLKSMHSAFSKGNEWAQYASMIIVVFSKKESDCDIKGREYYLFDTGMSVGFMMLTATELGLVAHPIAGYNEDKVKEIVGIPADMKVITLILVGKHSEIINPILSEKQVKDEQSRPDRIPLDKFVYKNKVI
ncbi:MAG: nitroreductase family protein [bacterium]|nr:nitroreductase family protein [bacterium]